MTKKKWLDKTIAVLAALAVWQIAAMAVGSSLLFPSVADVAWRLCTVWREPGFFAAVFFSLSRIFLGYLAALLCGAALGALAGRFRVAEILLRPYMVTVRSVPVVSFIVILLLWASANALPALIAFLIVLPVVYQNTLTGIRAVPEKMREMARVFHLSPLRRAQRVVLPTVEPFFCSAAATGAGLAWKSGIAAELIGLPTSSIGNAIDSARLSLESADVFAWTVVIVLLSVAFEKIFLFLLKKLFLLIGKV